MLTRITYASKVTRPLTRKDIHAILSASWENNASRNITGMLCYGNDRFLQYLEGQREAVEEIYAKIEADPRHRDIVILEQAEIPVRNFADWSMGSVDVSDDKVIQIIREVTTSDVFLPENLEQNQIIGLISGLKSSISGQFRVRPDNSEARV